MVGIAGIAKINPLRHTLYKSFFVFSMQHVNPPPLFFLIGWVFFVRFVLLIFILIFIDKHCDFVYLNIWIIYRNIYVIKINFDFKKNHLIVLIFIMKDKIMKDKKN